MGDRIIEGENPGAVINLSGACGAPLVQLSAEEEEDSAYYVTKKEENSPSTENLTKESSPNTMSNEYYVVGMHEGSVINSTEDLTKNLTFAINVSNAFDILLGAAEKTPEQAARPLMFNGFYIDQLLYTERIKTVEIVRDGKVIFTQDLRNFPNLYSDAHSELAFVGQTLQKGDTLRYLIQGEKHQIRIVEYPLNYRVP